MNVRTLLAKLPYAKLRIDLTGTNITTAAWVALLTSITQSCTAITVYYTGAGILKLSSGNAGSEDAGELALYLTPGMDGNLLIPFEIAKSKRFSARAVDQNVTAGELVFNFFG